MPRLFSGLKVPASIEERLSHLRGGLSGARWIDPENYHVTLRFFGDLDRVAARDIDNELSQIRCGRLTAVLQGLDVFGGAKPRAIIARIRADSALAALQADHERGARNAGLPPETRKFAPHVTLARMKATPASAVAEYLQSRAFGPPAAFRVERIYLFSSRASTGGGPYIVEAEYPLDSEPPVPVRGSGR